jgi:hypothetical protein
VSRLTSWLRGEKRPPKMPNGDYLGRHRLWPEQRSAAGIWIDGELWQLEGEPPPARSQGWGDMSWTQRHLC